jgi:hypothetical protein
LFSDAVSKCRLGGGSVITIFKSKSDIPQELEYVELNDIYFNQNTASMLDEKAKTIIDSIDESELVSKYKIRSRFDDITLDTDKLSAGCKTVLNVMYNPGKVFCMKECGSNALEVLFALSSGNVYSDYALIPFELESVKVQTSSGDKVINDYEELKEWWENEE